MAPTSGERAESEEDFEGEGKVVGAGEVVDEVGLFVFSSFSEVLRRSVDV